MLIGVYPNEAAGVKVADWILYGSVALLACRSGRDGLHVERIGLTLVGSGIACNFPLSFCRRARGGNSKLCL